MRIGTGIYLLWDTTNADLEQTIVLVGSSGAGKTSIFAKVRPVLPFFPPSSSSTRR
jgi:guanylate kinase